MLNETEVSELNAGLHELEVFLTVFDAFAKDSPFTEPLDYANGIISMISMQHAKVGELIEVAEKLESDVKGYSHDD